MHIDSHIPIIGIDGGRSKTTAMARGTDGVTHYSKGPGLEMIGHPKGRERVAAALREVLQPFTALGRFRSVCIGLNGLQVPSVYQGTIVELLLDIVDVRRIIVTSDVVTSYCGALGTKPGVVVAAGTGAISMAISKTHAVHIGDGHGYLVGDRGSGFAIGIAGLRGAAQYFDGAGGSEMLADLARHRFGNREGLLEAIYGSAHAVPLVAAFSEEVAAAAAQGDQVSLQIISDAGKNLAQTALAVAQNAQLPLANLTIALVGGLFNIGPALTGPLMKTIRTVSPQAQFITSSSASLEGAIFLADQPAPVLHDRIHWYAVAHAR
jgi:N-acetylglucosamine kinase-like BadF-type ATPase